MIAGLVRPDDGQVVIGGRDVTNVPVYSRTIGMVFQNYALFPNMTVAQNIAFGLESRKLDRSEIRERVSWAIRFVQLDDLEQRYPSQLSGGQQQRVALARALVLRPSVLLLDEPLSNLDAKLRHQMRIEIRRVQQELNITTVFVTHDQEEALAMSDKIAVMQDGNVVQVGRPVEIYERPSDAFVANFVGDSNLWSGRVETINGRPAFRTDSGLGIQVEQSVGGDELPLHSESYLMLRPENVLINPSETCANRYDASVVDVAFLGSVVEVVLRLEHGDDVRARSTSPAYRRLAAGDRVVVGWLAEAGVVVPAQGASASSDAGTFE